METILLVVHLLIAIGLVALVLLQKSEGGALGMGGGGGGGMVSARGAANTLTRATVILAVCFFITSIGLTLLAQGSRGPESVTNIEEEEPAEEAPSQPAPPVSD